MAGFNHEHTPQEDNPSPYGFRNIGPPGNTPPMRLGVLDLRGSTYFQIAVSEQLLCDTEFDPEQHVYTFQVRAAVHEGFELCRYKVVTSGSNPIETLNTLYETFRTDIEFFDSLDLRCLTAEGLLVRNFLYSRFCDAMQTPPVQRLDMLGQQKLRLARVRRMLAIGLIKSGDTLEDGSVVEVVTNPEGEAPEIHIQR